MQTDFLMRLGKNLSLGIVCKYIKDAKVDKKVGQFFGESKNGLPHGKGIFVTWENNSVKEILLQTFFEGKSQTNGRYISLDPINGSFIVMVRTIKDGVAYDTGKRYMHSSAQPYFLKDGKECTLKESDFPEEVNGLSDEFFLAIGTDLENPILGARTVKYVSPVRINGSTSG